ncbi:MAG: hypothetical protein OXH57_12715, partial [Ekhidna sp.]|nr:hypothetical protein [Ekhidna sp.]
NESRIDTVVITQIDTVQIILEQQKHLPQIIRQDTGSTINQRPLDDVRKVFSNILTNPTYSNITIQDAEFGPTVLYGRSHTGQYRVFLDIIRFGNFNPQIIYQFAHEYCHIISNYRAGDDQNLWFEEVICMIASGFALNSLRDEYPYAWSYYNRNFYRTGVFTINDLSDWYWNQGNWLELQSFSWSKHLHSIISIANSLSDIFNEDPVAAWNAVTYMNTDDQQNAGRDFETYIKDWWRYTPQVYQHIPMRIANRFGIYWEASKPSAPIVNRTSRTNDKGIHPTVILDDVDKQ